MYTMLAFLALLGAPYIYDISSLRVNIQFWRPEVSDCLFIILRITTAIYVAAATVIKFYFVTNNSINSCYSVINHTQATYKRFLATSFGSYVEPLHTNSNSVRMKISPPYISKLQMYTKHTQFIYIGLFIKVNQNILIRVVQTCGYGDEPSGSKNVGNFLTSCRTS